MLSSAGNLAIALLVLAYILWNQLRRRVLRTALVFPFVLLVLGIANLSQYLRSAAWTDLDMAILAASLLFVAIGLGALRAYTVLIWVEGGKVWRQGTYVTAGLWMAGAAIHAGLDAVAHGAAATYLLYLGLTFLAQRLVLERRAKGIAGSDMA